MVSHYLGILCHCLLFQEELESQLQAERREVTQVQRFLDDARQNEAWERHKHLSSGFILAKRIMLEQQGKSSFHLCDVISVLLD